MQVLQVPEMPRLVEIGKTALSGSKCPKIGWTPI